MAKAVGKIGRKGRILDRRGSLWRGRRGTSTAGWKYCNDLPIAWHRVVQSNLAFGLNCSVIRNNNGIENKRVRRRER